VSVSVTPTPPSHRDSQELLEKLQLIILQHTLDPARVRSALNHTRARLTDLDQQLTATLKTLVTRKITNSNNKQLLDEMRVRTGFMFTGVLWSGAQCNVLSVSRVWVF